MSHFNEFIDYVMSFYAQSGLYDMSMTRGEALIATGMRLMYCKLHDVEFQGDSIDREAVRDLVFDLRSGEMMLED